MSRNEPALRGVWLAIIVLSGAFVAVLAGVAFHVIGAPLPTALGVSGTAFVGAVTLGIAVRTFLNG